MSAILINKFEISVKRLPVLETLVFGYFLYHDKRFYFNDYLFQKVYWASGLYLMGKVFTYCVSSLLVHQREQSLLKSKPRGCYFM